MDGPAPLRRAAIHGLITGGLTLQRLLEDKAEMAVPYIAFL